MRKIRDTAGPQRKTIGMGGSMHERPLDVMFEKEIAMLAYGYWERRGRPFGTPDVDWYRAEEELKRQEKTRRIGGIH